MEESVICPSLYEHKCKHLRTQHSLPNTHDTKTRILSERNYSLMLSLTTRMLYKPVRWCHQEQREMLALSVKTNILKVVSGALPFT